MLTGGKFAFHLLDNPLMGAAEGEIAFTQDALSGILITAQGRRKFHGRPKRPADDRVWSLLRSARQGPGFREITLESGGKAYTLPERMRFHHVPAVSLARIENYKVVEVGAFGITDLESGTPVDTQTLFQAGGMGSPLINLLALRLVAQGRLDLDREVNASLKSARIFDNAFTRTRKTTVRDLMNGASGLSQYKFGGYRPGLSLPTLSELLAGADPVEMEPLEPVRMPGTFGGEGVCGAILQQVIEDATEESFFELMQRQIFTPLGMRHSSYAAPRGNGSRHKIALGHYATGETTLDSFHVYPENGDFLPVGYLYHGGASYGYYANHATHLSDGSGIVVMENRNLSWALNNEIIRAVLKRRVSTGL